MDMPKPLRNISSDSTESAPATLEVSSLRTQPRRRFSVADKHRIVRAADACVHGELGSLLRKEGVYHTQLSGWRAQLAESGSAGLAARKPGPAPKSDAKDLEIQALQRQVHKLSKALGQANGLIELQKKVQAMFSAMQPDDAPCTP